jgi:hypothetical protein
MAEAEANGGRSLDRDELHRGLITSSTKRRASDLSSLHIQIVDNSKLTAIPFSRASFFFFFSLANMTYCIQLFLLQTYISSFTYFSIHTLSTMTDPLDTQWNFAYEL